MRVLIIRNAWQKDTGGAEQYSFNLALALKRAGHVPIVVTKHKAIHQKCHDEDIKTIEGIWHESQEWGRHYHVRKLLMPLWYTWLIIRHKIDLINPQSRDDFIFATSAADLMGKPSIWTDHADLKYIMDRVKHPHPRMQEWILKASKSARIIIVVSKSEYESVVSVAPEFKSKLSVVHNGVFRPREVVGATKSAFIIGTNARLVPEKGVQELLEAFAKINAKLEKTELWIVGGLSNNEDWFISLASKLGVEKNIQLIGYVQDPNEYVASMDIFVHASYHEAFSLAIIEACMLGKTIVATAVGGTPEIINKSTGILVEPKSAIAIEEAIDKLLKNPSLRERLGKKAKEMALKEFEFQHIVENKIIPLFMQEIS